MGTLKTKKKKVILKNEIVNILFFSLLLTEANALLSFHMFNALCILILSSQHKVYFHFLALIYGLNSK